MKGDVDGRGAICNLFSKAMQAGMVLAAITVTMFVNHAEAKYSAGSDQIAVGKYELRSVMAGSLRLVPLPAAENAFERKDDENREFRRVNPKLISSGAIRVAISTSNTPAIPEVSPHIVVAAADGLLADTRRINLEVRYANTPDHKDRDLVSGKDASTSSDEEPRIFGMMLAGLGMMGFVASRR